MIQISAPEQVDRACARLTPMHATSTSCEQMGTTAYLTIKGASRVRTSTPQADVANRALFARVPPHQMVTKKKNNQGNHPRAVREPTRTLWCRGGRFLRFSRELARRVQLSRYLQFSITVLRSPHSMFNVPRVQFLQGCDGAVEFLLPASIPPRILTGLHHGPTGHRRTYWAMLRASLPDGPRWHYAWDLPYLQPRAPHTRTFVTTIAFAQASRTWFCLQPLLSVRTNYE